MNGRTDVASVSCTQLLDMPRSARRIAEPRCRSPPGRRRSEAVAVLDDFPMTVTEPIFVMVVATSPSAASAADGDELGTVIAAWGDPDELLEATGEPHALTSDSTRRAGVVADVDPAATVAEWLDLPYDAGAPMERTGEPAPLDLYERYLQQRRLAVPAAAASWGVMLLFGLGRVRRARVPTPLSRPPCSVVGALVATLPWLALGLLLVGHLPSLTARPWSLSSCVRRSRRSCSRDGSQVTARDLRRAWRDRRRRHPRDPRHRGRARLAGGRDTARRRRTARRRPLLRDAEHRDRHRPRVGDVRRASDPRGHRFPAPRRLRARRRLAVDRCELRRRDHALRGRRAVARRSAAAGRGGSSS